VRTVAILGLILCATTGCAIHYYDLTTGTEHIWGIGHMAMKASAPREGLRAVVVGTDVFGLTGGNVGGQGYLTIGWERRRQIEVLDENTAIRLEWPDGDFFNVRIGSEWPHIADQPNSKEQESEK